MWPPCFGFAAALGLPWGQWMPPPTQLPATQVKNQPPSPAPSRDVPLPALSAPTVSRPWHQWYQCCAMAMLWAILGMRMGLSKPCPDTVCWVSSCVHQQCLAVGRRAAPLLVLVLQDPCCAAGADSRTLPFILLLLGGCWEDTEQTNWSNNAFQEPLASSRSAEVGVMSARGAPALQVLPCWRGERHPELSCGRLCGKATSCASAPIPPKEHF